LLSTLVAASVQAVMMLAGFLVLGIPGAVLAAGATFVFAWIPLLGSTPVAIAGAIYLYSQGDIGRLIALIVLAVVVCLLEEDVPYDTVVFTASPYPNRARPVRQELSEKDVVLHALP
jgi:predicted PurR-regulated permease PerM